MSTPARTPGPWRAADYMARAELIEGPEGQQLAMRQDGATVADMLLMADAPALLASLAEVLPYAESRAEDLSEHKEAGNEDPAYPGAVEAWEAIERARALLAAAGIPEGTRPGKWWDA